MIDIKIGKLKEYDCGNCYGIEDENFDISETEISERNFISYSGNTRDSFTRIFPKKIFDIFQENSYIQISKILEELQQIEGSIESYGGGDIWKWFIQNCEKALEKYGDKAYIFHDMYGYNNNFYWDIEE